MPAPTARVSHAADLVPSCPSENKAGSVVFQTLKGGSVIPSSVFPDQQMYEGALRGRHVAVGADPRGGLWKLL